ALEQRIDLGERLPYPPQLRIQILGALQDLPDFRYPLVQNSFPGVPFNPQTVLAGRTDHAGPVAEGKLPPPTHDPGATQHADNPRFVGGQAVQAVDELRAARPG